MRVGFGVAIARVPLTSAHEHGVSELLLKAAHAGDWTAILTRVAVTLSVATAAGCGSSAMLAVSWVAGVEIRRLERKAAPDRLRLDVHDQRTRGLRWGAGDRRGYRGCVHRA
jgi:hypothetical protein